MSSRVAFALLLRLAAAMAVAGSTLGASSAAYAAEQTEAVADEAVAIALKLPPGYKRDAVLRAVSRNLRWFGSPDAGVRAARAMTDGGVGEVPLGTMPGPPRYVPLREAMPTSNPCDAGLWRTKGGVATKPNDREAWARSCLLTRDFDWIGPPAVEQVRAAAAGLPPGEMKGAVLVMLVRVYGDPDTLRYVQGEVDRSGPSLPAEVRVSLAKMLVEPAILYRLGRKAEALSAARAAHAFAPRAEMIRLLVGAGDTEAAAAVFELLADTPPEFGEDCFGWFGPISGLRLSLLGNAVHPAAGVGAFLDRIAISPLFQRVCPNGLDRELAVAHLLAAGRLDAAIAKARQEKNAPFLLIDALLQVGQIRLQAGDRATAHAYAEEAAAVLPPFDPGDPIDPEEANRATTDMNATVTKQPQHDFGERSGDTHRRFEIIQLLAATGDVTGADALARGQPDGALRAVALSAAVAGRAGLHFGDQAPVLSVVTSSDL